MGKLHIYCGDGKGKTTASIGLAIRALGSGYSIVFTQFLKGSDTGELEVLRNMSNVKIVRSNAPMKFTYLMDEWELQECKKLNDSIFMEAISNDLNSKTLLVLDEILGAIECNLLKEKLLMDFLQSNPCCEVVLTGRKSSDKLLKLADYVTEMKKVKHPYDKEVGARKGIEY